MQTRSHNSNSSALKPGVLKREVFAWSMYDFANSGYTTVVLTAVFNAYFVSVVAQKAEWATFAWTAILAVSYLAVMIAGPFIGAYADAHAAKKRVLMMVTAGCVISTAMLYYAGPGMIFWAGAFIVISNFCYAIGENIAAALHPGVSSDSTLSQVRDEVRESIPEFARFLDLFASPQIKNVATLIGNVGQDPEIRSTTNGGRVATFSLATSRTWNGPTRPAFRVRSSNAIAAAMSP